jgi:integrase
MSRPARPRFHPGNHRWCAQIGPPKRPGGKSSVVYFPKTIREEDEAGAWVYFRDYLRRVADPEPIAESGLTLGVLAYLYVEWSKAEAAAGRMTVKQWKNKRSHLRKLNRFIPDRSGLPLGERLAIGLDAGDMGGLVLSLQGADYSPDYIKNVIRSAHAMLNWAARPVANRDPSRPLIPANPVKGWKSGVTSIKHVRIADPAVIRAFRHWAWSRSRWGWIGGPAAARLKAKGRTSPTPAIRRKSACRFDRIFLLMVSFISLTGCRPKEACNARWSDLEWDDPATRKGGIIRLEKWKNRKKTGLKRTIPLTRATARILRAIDNLDGRNSEWIFTHRLGPRSKGYSEPGPHRIAGQPWPDGTALGAKLRKFRTWAVEADVRTKDGTRIETTGPNRLVNYLFRHTYISDALMKGYSSAETAALVGTSPEMIDRGYGHISEAHNRQLAEEIAGDRPVRSKDSSKRRPQ